VDTRQQLALLNKETGVVPFEDKLGECGLKPLRASSINILQLNITRKCTMACKHCHVNAGPGRTEMMSREVLEKSLAIAHEDSISTIDITGGSPEMHPRLEWFLEQLAKLNKRIIVRSNLVILLEEHYSRFMDIYARHSVEIVGSLPDYRRERSDRQRGARSFERSIEALRKLNEKGYGMEGSGLILDLMHNPSGAFLPASQQSLEVEYKRELEHSYGVHFSTLFSLTNCPIGRYLEYLVRSENLADYMSDLVNAYNPSAAQNVMCRTTLSVGWDGTLFDCDFNQMLSLSVDHGAPSHIDNFDFSALANREIVIGNHCYCCTAGAGSSCQGALE
jgi:radical SAM/Cys-rich protein